MNKLFIILISVSVICSSCGSRYESITDLKWLVGVWTSDAHDKKIYEQWKQVDDSTLLGSSFFIQKTDTLIRESMTIANRMGKLYFQAEVVEQDSTVNKTRFYALNRTKDQVVFENLLHDFPQKIVYGLASKDSMIAYIDGDYNGQYNRINFPMKKVR